MKRFSSRFGSALLVLCLLIALLPCAAFADSISMKGTVGEYMNWEWSTPNGENINSFTLDSEYFPDGINVTQSGSQYLSVNGVPGEAGTFWITAHVYTDNATYDPEFYIVIYGSSQKQTLTCYDDLSAKVGTAVSNWTWGTQDGENISNLYISSGSLPAGLTIPTPGSNAFSIEGTPTTAGSGSFTVYVETFDHAYAVQINYTISAAAQEFKITKSPTAENTKEGSNATFIATATGYSYVDWLLISNGNTVGTYRGESNTTYGSCTVITYKNNDKEYLVLRNIPASMNGFTVQARFTNSTGTSILTQACSLTVQASTTPTPTPAPTATPTPDMKAPTITLQPSDMTQDVSKKAILSVAASDPNGGTLSYQWYSNTSASTTGATAIAGANQSSYAAAQTVGTTYYYCSVTSTKDGKTSPAATTTPVGVTYTGTDASPAPSQSPAVSPSASPAVSPTAEPSETVKGEGHLSVILILLIVIIVLAVILLICQIIYISKRNKGEAVPLVKWTCPECGTHNKAGSRFCSECGANNPKLRK